MRQTAVHRSLFVAEVVKCTVNKAISLKHENREAGLSLKQMAGPESVKHMPLYSSVQRYKLQKFRFTCFSLGTLIHLLYFLNIFILQDNPELITCTFN